MTNVTRDRATYVHLILNFPDMLCVLTNLSPPLSLSNIPLFSFDFFFHPLWASWDMERPRVLGPLANSMRVGLMGGRSLVMSSTVRLLGQTPSGVGKGCRSCSVCGAPRPSLMPSSAGVKMGKGRVFLFGSSWCSLTPLSTVPTLKTPEGQDWIRERACHCRDRVSLRELSFMFMVCLWTPEKIWSLKNWNMWAFTSIYFVLSFQQKKSKVYQPLFLNPSIGDCIVGTFAVSHLSWGWVLWLTLCQSAV